MARKVRKYRLWNTWCERESCLHNFHKRTFKSLFFFPPLSRVVDKLDEWKRYFSTCKMRKQIWMINNSKQRKTERERERDISNNYEISTRKNRNEFVSKSLKALWLYFSALIDHRCQKHDSISNSNFWKRIKSRRSSAIHFSSNLVEISQSDRCDE